MKLKDIGLIVIGGASVLFMFYLAVINPIMEQGLLKLLCKIGTFVFGLLAVEVLYIDLTDRSHRFLYRLKNFVLLLLFILMTVLCHGYGYR